MRLSVIIPCYNAAAMLAQQLDGLAAQQWGGDWEVIVADNGSSDGSREVARKYERRLPALRVIDASARRGPGYARNCGARAAEGDCLAFCDADDEVGAGWLAAIAEALRHNSLVASRLDFTKLNATPLSHAQSAGLQRVAFPPYWPHAGGSGLAVRREVHEEVGGFDESLLYLEDTDYCFRCRQAGHPLHFAAAALVHVRLPARAGGMFHQARRWAQYNVLMNRRYGGGATIARPWRAHLQGWRNLLGCSSRLFDPELRPLWLKSLGTQVGVLEGALVYGVPPVG